jgi:NAD(P)-dependent dehydrogenase (short-subunit alcohol dehydrogenase family)
MVASSPHEPIRGIKNAQSDRLDKLQADTVALLRETVAEVGNRPQDLHQGCHQSLPRTSPVLGLKGMVCVIGGASRGIGQGIAVKFASAGAKVCVLGRSDGKVVTGPGTIGDVALQCERAGGEGLAVQCDVSDAASVQRAIDTIVAAHGIIDVVVPNASALFPYGVEAIDEKRYDLMNHVCVRGAYTLVRACLPHMVKSPNPHVLTVAPAPIPDRSWLGPFTCYGGAKVRAAATDPTRQ